MKLQQQIDKYPAVVQKEANILHLLYFAAANFILLFLCSAHSSSWRYTVVLFHLPASSSATLSSVSAYTKLLANDRDSLHICVQLIFQCLHFSAR